MISKLISMLPDSDPSGDDFESFFGDAEPLLLTKKGTLNKLKPGQSKPDRDGSDWKGLDGTTFVTRIGPDYARNKTKKPSKQAFYSCEAVDFLASRRKIPNIGRYFDLGSTAEKKKTGGKNQSCKAVPEVFLIQFQIPDYAPAIMTSQGDGEGYNLIFHYRLTDKGRKELKEAKSGAAKLFIRFLQAIRAGGGPQNSDHSLYLRPKAIMRLMNHEELGLGFVHRKICETFNAKPFLTRPEHTFHLAPDNSYLEIDIDVHLFKYFQRRCVHSFRGNFNKSIIDVGITIESQDDDEMPEQMLGACTISKFSHKNCLLVAENEETALPLVTHNSILSTESKEPSTPPAPTMGPPPPPPNAGDEEGTWHGMW